MSRHQPLQSPVTYTIEEAALQIGCDPRLLIELKRKGQGPELVELNGEVRYRPESLKHWLMRGAIR